MSKEALRKLRLISRVLIAAGAVLTIPLGVEIFGEANPTSIAILAAGWGICLLGGNGCTIVWGIETWRQQRKEKG